MFVFSFMFSLLDAFHKSCIWSVQSSPRLPFYIFLWKYWNFDFCNVFIIHNPLEILKFLWFSPKSQRWQSFSDMFNVMKRAFFSLTNKTSVGFSTAAWISFDIAVRPFYGAGDRSVAGFEHIGQEIGHRMDTSHHITICHHHHLYHTTILRRKMHVSILTNPCYNLVVALADPASFERK